MPIHSCKEEARLLRQSQGFLCKEEIIAADAGLQQPSLWHRQTPIPLEIHSPKESSIHHHDLINGLLSVVAAVLHLASLSSAGTANRANSGAAEVTYSHDGRTCCTNGEPSASFTGGKCEYDSHVLNPTIPEGTHVTKCCWSDRANDFHVHFADDHEDLQVSPMHITGNATVPIQICNLGLKWEITEYILTDDYLDIYVILNIDCGPYNEWDREWIRIHFDVAAYKKTKAKVLNTGRTYLGRKITPKSTDGVPTPRVDRRHVVGLTVTPPQEDTKRNMAQLMLECQQFDILEAEPRSPSPQPQIEITTNHAVTRAQALGCRQVYLRD
ncbi:uncharacterized protein TRIVIDRAFT_222080 [Trichoderma virens Gv29-8]|uniref:Uncharacterized protein n=1 Tax=Hypocrea virens (strain Gv29-8 / FGSC 10586) TaxID=413071 RepID=G9MRU7_HYPVG|nr:uncharacterized protein TRIVIDRAFT_222080 [Trichoderma virens Gv29-8]EHK22816.1 hypothetical protein TRIVIDRAFT_222080 [Trichoderma virens Gv29-8]UKZ47870.1 hypothetical protein TrVGV298_002103 [Trichoderma virens]